MDITHPSVIRNAGPDGTAYRLERALRHARLLDPAA
jgi:hypothetical protein